MTERDVEIIKEKVRPYYEEKRFSHVQGVVAEAEALGRIYLPEKINELKAAAYFHDITKRLDTKKQLQYCKEFGIILRDVDLASPATLHAITGADLVKREFHEYASDDIVRAVRYHTTGRAGMSVFEEIIYLADLIEETRTFDDCIALRRYFYGLIADGEDKKSALRLTMLRSLDQTVNRLLKQGKIINDETFFARNYYLTLDII